jgi:NitT/TauT family transport system substrate-binding protein
LLVSLFLVLAFLVAACGSDNSKDTAAGASSQDGSSATTTEAPKQLTKLTVTTSPASPDSVPIWVGDAQGFFADAGIKIDYLDNGAGPAIVASLVGGSSTIGDLTFSAMWPYLQKGTKLTALMANSGMLFDLIVRPGVKTPNIDKPFPQNAVDLKGLRIGVPAVGGGAGYAFVYRIAEAAGLDPQKDITYVGLPDPGVTVPAFKNGQIDGIAAYQPMHALIGDGNYKMVVDGVGGKTGDLFKGFITDVWSVRSDWLEKNGKTAEAFCGAVYKAHKFMRDAANIDAVAKAVEDRMGITPEQAKSFAKTAAAVSLSNLTKDGWDRQSKFQATPELQNFHAPYEQHVYKPCATLDPEGEQ